MRHRPLRHLLYETFTFTRLLNVLYYIMRETSKCERHVVSYMYLVKYTKAAGKRVKLDVGGGNEGIKIHEHTKEFPSSYNFPHFLTSIEVLVISPFNACKNPLFYCRPSEKLEHGCQIYSDCLSKVIFNMNY